MVPSKTYLKFKETRSQEDLETLNGYLLRLQQISVILNGDTELSNEEENKLYDEDETIIDYTIEYMEESMGWPDPDDQTTFNNQLA